MARTSRPRGAGSGTSRGLPGSRSILWALPAEACSCKRPDVDTALAEGHSVAIVTRPGDESGYRVEDSLGPAPADAFGNRSAGRC